MKDKKEKVVDTTTTQQTGKKKPSIYGRIWCFIIYVDVTFIFLMLVAFNSVKYVLDAEDFDQTAFFAKFNIGFIILFIVLGLLNTMFGFITLKPIRLGFNAISKAMNELTVGNLEFEVPTQNFREFADLATDTYELRDSTKAQADTAETVAHGDLTVDVKPRSDKDALGLSMLEMVQKNASALLSIREAIDEVATGANEVAKASESLAAGSTEQAAAIEQITASIMDVAEKTKVNANEAGDASSLVSEALSNVNVGNEHMGEMVRAMAEINESSESIYKIIKVIDDIAFQTNILALNAAVEAARAGEAGKGFSVVAEEVRNLAAKSAQAASETADMIADSITKVNAGSKIAEESSAALNKITENVQKSAELINNIADASNEQATAIAQIDQALEQVSQVVQNNSATSAECAASSEQLAGQARVMEDQVAIYKLPDPTELAAVTAKKPALKKTSPVTRKVVKKPAVKPAAPVAKSQEPDPNPSDEDVPRIILDDDEADSFIPDTQMPSDPITEASNEVPSSLDGDFGKY